MVDPHNHAIRSYSENLGGMRIDRPPFGLGRGTEIFLSLVARSASWEAKTGPSIPDTVEKVLKRAGKPLHVEEISKKIGVEAARIHASLQRYIKIKKRFKRTAAATFGLIPRHEPP